MTLKNPKNSAVVYSVWLQMPRHHIQTQLCRSHLARTVLHWGDQGIKGTREVQVIVRITYRVYKGCQSEEKQYLVPVFMEQLLLGTFSTVLWMVHSGCTSPRQRSQRHLV